MNQVFKKKGAIRPMRKFTAEFISLLVIVFTFQTYAGASDQKQVANSAAKAPMTPAEQIAAMGAMCAKTANSREARDKKAPLFKRLGGKSKINKAMFEALSLHTKNEKVSPFFAHTNIKAAAEKGTSWIISNGGGAKTYSGPDLKTSHAHRNITTEVFLAAGADIQTAFKNNGYKEDQIQDLMCLLGSHYSEIVIDAPKNATHASTH